MYVYLLLDRSLSMTVGDPPKLEVARSLAAAFAYLGMKRFDRVRLIPFGTNLEAERTTGRGRQAFPVVEKALEGIGPEGVTTFARTTRQFARRYPRRGLIVVLSDLMEAADWGESFRTLANLGHDLWVVRVTCREAQRPDLRGVLELHDAERDRVVQVRASKRLLEAYRQEVEAHVSRCREACLRVGGRFVEVPVERPLDELLEKVFRRGGPAR